MTLDITSVKELEDGRRKAVGNKNELNVRSNWLTYESSYLDRGETEGRCLTDECRCLMGDLANSALRLYVAFTRSMKTVRNDNSRINEGNCDCQKAGNSFHRY